MIKSPRKSDVLLRAMKEKQFQSWVIRVAKRFGWQYYHPYNSRKSVPGYPDLTLVRERVIFVELKTERGRLTPAQKEWRRSIERASGVEYYLWRPRHWRAVTEVLRKRYTYPESEAA